MSERKVGSVTYQEVGEEYFKQRGLRRHAGMWSLWALGVGAVISGEYYGWNFGLSTGGFGGLLVAGAIMAVMYYGLVYSLGDGPVGRVPHRAGREHGVRDHARGRGRCDGAADADRRRGPVRRRRQVR